MTYRSRTWVPPLAQQATEIAQQMGFETSSIPEVGRLLCALASGVRGGIIGEIGTGCGVGAAWIASGLAADTRFVTVEADGERATAVMSLFRDHPNVRVIHGDWHDILPYGPFDLLFVDASPAKYDEPDVVVESLRPGGLIVLDDLTLEEYWPPEWYGQPDVVRELWLDDARMSAMEVLTTPRTVAILATRIG